MTKERIISLIKQEIAEIRNLRDNLNSYAADFDEIVFSMLEDDSLIGQPGEYDYGAEIVSKKIKEVVKTVNNSVKKLEKLEKNRITSQNVLSKQTHITDVASE